VLKLWLIPLPTFYGNIGLEEIGGSTAAQVERQKSSLSERPERVWDASFEDFSGAVAEVTDFFTALIFAPLWIKPKGPLRQGFPPCLQRTHVRGEQVSFTIRFV
jgi:hypothetical protein